MEELERAIEADPEGTDLYLVYADALQERGDVRGELIALQYWATLDPDDPVVARQADEFLYRHRVRFLGGLLVYPARHFEFEWHMGFLRRVRMTFDPGDMHDALNALIECPSARFLARLEIQLQASPESVGMSARRPLDRRALRDHYRALAEQLAVAARPRTLRELILGKPGDFVAPDSLYAAFPGLRRDPEELLEGLRAAMVKNQRLRPKFDTKRLPPVVLRTAAGDRSTAAPAEPESQPGSESELDPAGLLRALEGELAKKRSLGVIDKLRLLATPASLDALALDLARQWQAMGEPTSRRWGFTIMGLVGGQGCVDFIGENLAGWHHQRAVQGLELLEQIGTPRAAHEIYTLAALPEHNQSRREHAWNALGRLAARRSLARETFIERIVPNDVSGAAYQRVIRAQTRRLYDLMISGQRMSANDFRHYVLRHPIRAPLAAQVVWGRYHGRHRLLDTFRVAEDRSLRKVGDSLLKLAADDNVGVWHPAETLAEAESASDRARAWHARLSERAIAPLFEQVERPVHGLKESEKSARELRRFARHRAPFHRMREVLESRDWQVHETREAAMVESWSKYFARDDITVVAELGPTSDSIETAWPARDRWQRARRALSSLHPVTISELIYDLELAHAQRGGHIAGGQGADPG